MLTIGLFFLAELAALVQCSSFFFKCRRRKINCELVQLVQLKRTDLTSDVYFTTIY